MAIFYTDVAAAQQQLLNFMGAPGQAQIDPLNVRQNNALFEGPPLIKGTYVWAGTEAQGDTINIAKLEAGWIVDPHGFVCNCATACATALTFGIGDNDMGYIPNLPVPNQAALYSQYGNPATTISAPIWVSGTTYALGNVVQDNAASSGAFAQYDTYTCLTATSGVTAPHSAAVTVWAPNYLRYSASIDPKGANSNVAFAAGASALQFYGGPPSILPFACTPGALPTGFTTSELLGQPYVIQNDCWLIARILTMTTPVANAVTQFHVPILTAN